MCLWGKMHAENSHIFICKAHIQNQTKQFWTPTLNINILRVEHKIPNGQEKLHIIEKEIM